VKCYPGRISQTRPGAHCSGVYLPEDRRACAHNGKVDFDAGEDDRYRRPPSEVYVGICCSFVLDDGLQSPNGCHHGTKIISIGT
jgi:hypothetical protein